MVGSLEPFRRTIASYRAITTWSLPEKILQEMAEGARTHYIQDVTLLIDEIERLRKARAYAEERRYSYQVTDGGIVCVDRITDTIYVRSQTYDDTTPAAWVKLVTAPGDRAEPETDRETEESA
jgi:hypothetical protein